MTYTRTALAAIGTALVLSLALTALASATAHARMPVAKRVALTDARHAPDYIQALPARHRVTITRQCVRGSYWSDTSAYSGTGRAIGAQRWSRDGTIRSWRTRSGRVTFDGITFTNYSRRTVLVAGWCEHTD